VQALEDSICPVLLLCFVPHIFTRLKVS
jgi:hypothetical protein